MRGISSVECEACGARQVGDPVSPPDIVLPKLGLPIGSIICVALIVAAFLAVWVFGNDMKVGRVLLIYALGDETRLTQSLLKADPKLPLYRIFAYDGYRVATMLSFGLIPVSFLGIWLAWRGRMKALLEPAKFGGLSMARISLTLSVALCITFSSILISSIPGALNRSREKRLAATRAMMYELHQQALQKYYKEYGSYPQELSDLVRVSAESAPQSDYWKRNFNYQPIGVIASKGSAISFTNYKLVSAGPDGKPGTDDDITMVDGVIVENEPEDDMPATLLAPERPRR